jgi:hypothetical protein
MTTQASALSPRPLRLCGESYLPCFKLKHD